MLDVRFLILNFDLNWAIFIETLTNFYECVLYAKNHFKSHFTARAGKSAGKQGGF